MHDKFHEIALKIVKVNLILLLPYIFTNIDEYPYYIIKSFQNLGNKMKPNIFLFKRAEVHFSWQLHL